MLNQARELKAKLDRVEKELGNTSLTTSSGQGAVTVTINGKLKIRSIKISAEVINPDKAGKLEELVLKAVSEAIDGSQKLAAKQLKAVTGGLKIPGLTSG